MNRNMRKILIFALAAALCLTLIPAAALAIADDSTWTPEKPFAGDTVAFTGPDTVLGYDVLEWNWEFGNGTTGTGQYPSCTYADPGEYRINLVCMLDDSPRPPRRYVLPVRAIFVSPPAPDADAVQILSGSGKTLDSLAVSGQNLQWYSAVTGGYNLLGSTLLPVLSGNTPPETYYVSQTVNGVESVRREVSAAVKAQPVIEPAANQLAVEYGGSQNLAYSLMVKDASFYSGTLPVQCYIDSLLSGTANFSSNDSSDNISVPGSAVSSMLPGQYSVTMKSDGNTYNEAAGPVPAGTLTVTGVTGVSVSPAGPTVHRGKTQTFLADVQTQEHASLGPVNRAVTWSVSGGSDSTIDPATGVLAVGANETATSLTVTATTVGMPTMTATTNVTIQPPAVNSVAVTPKAITVGKGGTQQFKAAVEAVSSAPETVEWSVSGNADPNTKISADGLLTVGANETNALTVTAKSTFDNTKADTAAVTVSEQPPVVTNVTISPKTAAVAKGGTQQFSAAVSVENNAPQTVSWSVSGNADPSTKISADGLLTVGANETNALSVTAASTFDSTKTDTAAVTVTAAGASPQHAAGPKTGDGASLGFWTTLALLAACGIVFLALRGRKGHSL